MAARTSTTTLCSACRASLFPWTLPLRQSIQASRPRPLRINSSSSSSSSSNSGRRQRRNYATTSSRPSGDSSDTSSSSSSSSSSAADNPPAWPTSPNPTPYEIFDMSRRDTYTKRRFHQLVKLYHPDTSPPPLSSSSSSSLSPSTRVERYRLVIAANAILSDPSRRHLYDHHHGAGWTTSPSSTSDLRTRDREWRHHPNSAARNATWEDWEEWHQQQRRRRQHAAGEQQPPEPVYMPNGLFAALVVAMCLVGAMAQRSRAQAAGEQYVGLALDRNADIGRQVASAASAAAGRSREERIDLFVREREESGGRGGTYRYRPRSHHDAPPSSSEGPPVGMQQQQQREQHRPTPPA